MNVVVVESPAKAKTINKYLGEDFVVLPSYGHVRDLPSKEGSVRPDDEFEMIYETDARALKHLDSIAKALKGAEHLFLATDPDREGEAISWHVLKVLEDRNVTGGIDVKRVVFNEITKDAVIEAMRHPRDLDMDLINAQQARRALDYLVGFTLSPVLWRKLPGARSAGRVQSVALRLICERALEIESFEPQEYWTIAGDFLTAGDAKITARLVTLDGEKLGKFALGDTGAAAAARAAIEGAPGFAVTGVDSKESARHPPPPFTTSTLQQEAARKLRMPTKRTMNVAQRLYEGIDLGGETVGLITYMRTDGVQIANEALAACRGVIGRQFGDAYVPKQARVYKAKAKNAQEAHEAIRPSQVARTPSEVAPFLDPDQHRLYELIWKRTVASQMASARIENASIDIADNDGRTGFRATGSMTLFDGFLKLYQEGRDDGNETDDDRALPKATTGDRLTRTDVRPAQHFTEPAPRYTEASLVKKLEELGIGRPSTYASILSVLQDRDYVILEKGRFEPEDRGLLVTAFLTGFFKRYVEYGFTADLETQLDEISAGKVPWKDVLHAFWRDFKPAVDEVGGLRTRDVLEALNEILGPHLFPSDDSDRDPRACPACDVGRLSVKTGRYGAFVGCSNYPECRYTRSLTAANGDGAAADPDEGPRELGSDPESNLPVSLRKGPYGAYVQLGESGTDEKPKRVSLPKGLAAADVDLERALALLALPREVGLHPETNKTISAGIGRYGPYLRHDGHYAGLESDDDVFSVGLNRAVTLLAQPRGRGRGSQQLREIGAHPVDSKPVKLMRGRYGPYVSHNRVNASLPKGIEPDEVTLDQAVELLRARPAKTGRKPTGSRAKPAKRKASGGKAPAAGGQRPSDTGSQAE